VVNSVAPTAVTLTMIISQDTKSGIVGLTRDRSQGTVGRKACSQAEKVYRLLPKSRFEQHMRPHGRRAARMRYKWNCPCISLSIG
jgi:hypothetical protein